MEKIYNILKSGSHLKPFPDKNAVFCENQTFLENHLLPLVTIDLQIINKDWSGIALHMLCPIEPYENLIGSKTKKFHNEFLSTNWLAFRVCADNKYEFLGDEKYFHFARDLNEGNDLSENELEHIQTMRASYENSKINYLSSNKLIKNGAQFGFINRLGGGFEAGNWADSLNIPSAFEFSVSSEESEAELHNDGLSIRYNGNCFHFVAQVAGYNYCEYGPDEIILMYEPVSRIVLFTYDWS